MIKKIKLIIFIIFILIGVFIISILFQLIYIKNNNNSLSNSIKSLNKDEIILLENVIPFKWDKIYTFAPYIPKETIENIIGTKSNYISESLGEDTTQLIFIKNGKLVASVIGHNANLGYDIDFYDGESIYNIITYGDNIKFLVQNKDDIIILKKQY